MGVGSDLYKMADDYLLGRVDFDALDGWLAQHAQELASLPDNDSMGHLAGYIQVALAEMDDGVATEADLLRRIKDFISEHMASLETSVDAADEHIEFVGGDFTVSSKGYSLQPVEHKAA